MLESVTGGQEWLVAWLAGWVALRANDIRTARHVSENLGRAEQIEANEGMSYGVRGRSTRAQ